LVHLAKMEDKVQLEKLEIVEIEETLGPLA